MRKCAIPLILLFFSLNISCIPENPEEQDKEQDKIAALILPVVNAARETSGSVLSSGEIVYPTVSTSCRSEYTVLVSNPEVISKCKKCHDPLLAAPAFPVMEDSDSSYFSAILLINPGSVVNSVFYQTAISTWHTEVTSEAANHAIINWIFKCNPQL
ncbi:MAG: hypothetical protein OEZ34_07350 [Spirochaetia bacterium]|nr:hypothetical protein [Spirochaetia bacterium]